MIPKGVPNDIARRWNLELHTTLKDSTLVEKVASMESITFTGGTPAELAKILEQKCRFGEAFSKLANLR